MLRYCVWIVRYKKISHTTNVCWYHDLFVVTRVTGYEHRFWTSSASFKWIFVEFYKSDKIDFAESEPNTIGLPHSMHELPSLLFCVQQPVENVTCVTQ